MGTTTLDDDGALVDDENVSVRVRVARAVRRLPVGLGGAVCGAAIGLCAAPVLYTVVLGAGHTQAIATVPPPATTTRSLEAPPLDTSIGSTPAHLNSGTR